MNSYVKDVFIRVLQSSPKITIEDVKHNGDIIFCVKIKDLGIDPSELQHPIFRTRFFVNFTGEMMVRRNVELFADILTGLDPNLYDKIICGCKHTDFGMYIDNKEHMARWQMHISLIQQILTEDFDRILDTQNGTSPSEEEDMSSEDGM